MQIILADAARALQRQSIAERERVNADEADDFIQLALFLQQRHRLLYECRPFRRNIFIEPAFESIEVERIALQPIDRREVTGISQLAGKSPEHLYDAERCLRDRL